MMRFCTLLAILSLAFVASPAAAHEMRPAYLDMRETAPDEFALVWKVPAQGEMRLGLYVRLPDTCRANAKPRRSIEGGAYIERWSATCEGGLKGKEIAIDGLRSTMTDALARIAHRDGTTEISRLKPEAPTFIVADAQTSLEVASTYFRLGVDHILSGFDHLLFVFALFLLIRDPVILIKTVTAFTIAHSITLAGASLGYFSLPQKPVEATIALSIAFVASELVKMKPDSKRLSESYPWLVAFAFGLLHGFGFAGALKEIGLPQSDVPLALLTFNVGVEVGQLLFLTLAFVLLRAFIGLFSISFALLRTASGYLLGAISTFWLVGRLASF
ncbi:MULTISPECIES: HupE/UreJ family protein [Rhizobium/Agrobacterium group]|uniref:HupE/UreJ family protein n=1 Tax=Neorhizobium petrolearium TaxID=515361 RepID=A0ABY8MB51_9HYPH|nr:MULTISPECIES: HupE/UreJ family protein [Rhizobium/Agrobacterium group]KGE02272.1 membrane protein [Rhizobium sp. YS-1r]MCC2614187.1 HupE/UreJ family protein [Neorhizobium petrolearium]WGI71697.1 HupE/UreJ family protein [Neorhizobium petrolearium]